MQMDIHNEDYNKLLQIIPEIKIWQKITKHMPISTLNVFLNSFPVMRLFCNLYFINKVKCIGTLKLDENARHIYVKISPIFGGGQYYDGGRCGEINIYKTSDLNDPSLTALHGTINFILVDDGIYLYDIISQVHQRRIHSIVKYRNDLATEIKAGELIKSIKENKIISL